MAIAMECFNIIVSKDVIADRFPGGLAQFEKEAGPSFLADEHLTRRGAMNWYDVESMIQHLGQYGIRYLDTTGKSVHIVVVDVFRGPMTPCDWIEFDSGEQGPRCWLRGANPGKLVKPNRPPEEEGTIVAFRHLPGL